ncbi:hypothetical protein FPZ12_013690 [Amycolatopsis acidicola]|uniref:Uncharacterized protein n=1 Tax=Amycolatopsis acidicola TaxID=2596893 RepID=A0A5N0V782_9PSEU|nr:hypothetical protein [Amycolatopsis acidicola]KAA9161564.1 hypothetical protein FPZ12_013690 [Amycolatopsis acidicola]
MVAPQYPPARGDTAPLPRIPAGRNKTRGPLFKGLGLVAVAVVAGLVWWLIQHDSGATPVAQAPAKEFTFTPAEGPVASTDCAGKSTASVKKYFSEHPCQGLSRALYDTTASGNKALVSVVLVTMPTPADAQQLKTILDGDNTGNVNDLVRDGTAKIADAPKLYTGKYASRLTSNQVTVVLAGFFGDHKDDATIGRVANEALDLSSQLRTG